MSGILLLNGGGLDSAAQLILLSTAGYRVRSLHIDYGQDAAASERRQISFLSESLNQEFIQVVANKRQHGYLVPLVGGHALTACAPETERAKFELAGRNMMLLSIALPIAVSEGIEDIVLCLNTAPEYYKDATLDFTAKVNRFWAEVLGVDQQVRSPYANMTKLAAVSMAYQINKQVLDAHSCYREIKCGVCPHCISKKEIVKICAG